METTIYSIEREMNQMKKWIGEEDKIVVDSMKETIETIKQIRQRKTTKEIEKNPKRKRTIQGECDDQNEELEEMWKEFHEERYLIDKEKEREYCVSDICGMKIKEKLFDSKIHKWNIPPK